MKSPAVSPTFLWQSCGEPSAAWFLVWMPPALLALESDATLASAMVRLLAVLLVAGMIWARGLGPGGVLAERLFVATWAGSWAGALGALVTAGAWPSSVLGSIGLFVTLFVGAGWLGWAYHERQELRSSRSGTTPFGAARKAPATIISIVMAWLLATILFALMVSSKNAHWGDGFVFAMSLGCFTAFQRGSFVRAEPTG